MAEHLNSYKTNIIMLNNKGEKNQLFAAHGSGSDADSSREHAYGLVEGMIKAASRSGGKFSWRNFEIEEPVLVTSDVLPQEIKGSPVLVLSSTNAD